jgi:RNA polymerase sigma factor (sigma-70 family)
MAKKPSRFRQLLEEVRKGSEEATREVVESYSPAMLTIIRRHLHPRVRSVLDSVDVLQDFWAEILTRAIPANDFESTASFFRFLAKVAETKVLQANRHWLTIQKRSLKRERHGLVPREVEKSARITAGDHEDEEAWLEEELEARLKRLPEEMRVIVRRYRQGVSLTKIARSLKLSEQTVRRRLQDLLGGAEIPDRLGDRPTGR